MTPTVPPNRVLRAMNRRAAIVALVALPAAARGFVVEAAMPGRMVLSGELLRDFTRFQAAVQASERALRQFELGAQGVGVALANMERAFSRHG